MPVLRWSPPLLIVVAIVGFSVVSCTGSAEGPSTELAAVEATTIPTVASADTSATSTPANSDNTSSDNTSSDNTVSVTTASSTSTSETSTSSTSATTSTTATIEATSSTQPSTSTASQSIPIRIRLDRRVDDAATEGFDAFVEDVLTDGRGWSRAGFVFSFDDSDFDYTVVLAEGSEVDSLCLPYDTFGRFSCQIGPTVALNADRWRTAVDSWPASLEDYRTMLVNHEVGHLIGQHHPATRCPGDGQPAPVMAQQSSGVAPCVANPWPLPWEVLCAASGLEPLAPPYERDITLTCGPDGPVG